MLGGPSASASPEMYPDIDYLHIGEMGDATDRLIACLDESVARPPAQIRFETKDRLPLQDFPIPAYDLIPLKNYLMLTLQFSSGCPYLCEFCDIPNLYGRQPRFKTAAQVTAELDAMRRQKGHPPVVYFVDDNFVGNRKAAKDMLPHLVAWQKQHGYPMSFACEATLNIAKQQETLELMRESSFLGIFVGIETPEADALKAMRKNQNVAVPMMESIKTLNDYGLEVTSGIILGLDTDSDDTEARLKDFIEISHIPMLTINLLQALPKTPLWDRLKVAGRLSDDPTLESNVCFLRPYDDVVSMWRRCIAYANDPERLFAALPSSGRIHLCEPDDHARARQAHLGKPFERVGAGVPRHAAHRHPVGLSQAVLARRASRVAPRPDRCRARHGLHRPSPHPVHARGAARRAERVVLLDQIAHGRARAYARTGDDAAQVGVTALIQILAPGWSTTARGRRRP